MLYESFEYEFIIQLEFLYFFVKTIFESGL